MGILLPPPQIITPCGFDRATGQTPLGGQIGGTLPGTPDPPGYYVVNGVLYQDSNSAQSAIPFQELADSPAIEIAEQSTIVHRFVTSYTDGYSRLEGLPRGIIRTDSFGNSFKLLSANINMLRGGICMLTTTEEAITFDLPPDEFSCVPFDLGINIIKHPRYLYALLQQPGDSDTTILNKQAIVALIQQYMEAPTPPQKSGVVTQLAINSGVDTIATTYAKAAAQEIVQKLWLQQDSPNVSGYNITWAQYFNGPQYLNPGGYIEDPIWQGNLPAYFGSPDQDYSISTIFDNLPALNPQCYSSSNPNYTSQYPNAPTLNVSSLRNPDTEEYQRTWTRITHSWTMCFVGNWDAQIYSQLSRPLDWTSNNPNPYQLLKSLTNN